MCQPEAHQMHGSAVIVAVATSISSWIRDEGRGSGGNVTDLVPRAVRHHQSASTAVAEAVAAGA